MIEIVAAGAIRLKLPDAYVSTHDVFSVHDMRPWMHAPERRLELDYPDVVLHPTLNRVVHVLDRKRYGRAPRSAGPLDIPAQYCYNPESAGSQAPGPDVCTRRRRSDIPVEVGQYVLTIVSRHYVACEH